MLLLEIVLENRPSPESGTFGLHPERDAEVDHHAVQAKAYSFRRIITSKVTEPSLSRGATWKDAETCVEGYCELATLSA